MSGKTEVRALLAIITNAVEAAMAEYDKTGHEIPSLRSTDGHPLDDAGDTVSLKKAIRLIEASIALYDQISSGRCSDADQGACDQLCATLAPPHHTMINRAQNHEWACISVVLQARIADALGPYPQGVHVDKLSKAVNIEKGKLARILRLLATRNCFVEVERDVFANNRLSLILQSASPVADLAYCHLGIVSKANAILYQNFTTPPYADSYELSKSPFMHAVESEGIEGGYFQWLNAHVFGRAMIGMGRVMGSSAVLYNYSWDSCKTLCDVGSGLGNFSLPFAQRYPMATVTLLDLAGTIAQAKDFWAKEYPEAVAARRVHFVEGDFMVPITVKDQDIYYVSLILLLANILHDWPDAEALNILRSVRSAMASHSRLLIHEYVLEGLSRGKGSNPGTNSAPEPLLPNFGAGSVRAYYQDYTMLALFNSRERTEEEFSALAGKVGLVLGGVFDMGETCLLEYRISRKMRGTYDLPFKL
ncbi:O-methyltransferase-domain-containing protein [Mycena capillaripes]|nr:O-methyltransferase-domain-containing protein [Mycena capillaripes]